MRRALIFWSVIFGLAIVGFAIVVTVVNSTLYSAGGFVHGYLDSLARHDAAGALELADIPEPSTTDAAAPELVNDDLLIPELLGTITDIELVSDIAVDDGSHRVTFSYVVGGKPGQSTYVVVPGGTTLGLFTDWRFGESPLSTVALTVLHDARFDVNGTDFVSPAEPTRPAQYAVFTPGYYEFGHESQYLTASTKRTAVFEVGETTQVVVDVQANEEFVQQVQEELNAYFDDKCVPQQVLMPTACPFGQPMRNRIISTPTWTMSEYPPVRIVPGNERGTWLMPPTNGAAHLAVDVQSLFDGSITSFHEDVPFTVSYVITFLPNNELYIEAQN